MSLEKRAAGTTRWESRRVDTVKILLLLRRPIGEENEVYEGVDSGWVLISDLGALVRGVEVKGEAVSDCDDEELLI